MTNQRTLINQLPSAFGAGASDLIWIGVNDGMGNYVSKKITVNALDSSLTSAVTSVNGLTGAVVLTTSNIAEGSNLYFTDTRARAAMTGAISNITSANLTSGFVLVSGVTGKIALASTTTAEIGFVAGVTSGIQTQLNNKQALNASLTSISGLSVPGSDGLIYRMASSSNYAYITFGAGLAFSGGILSATVGTVMDADYGDITVSSAGTIWTIDNGVVSSAKMTATGVSAGSYTTANVTVDAQGRITAASNGAAGVSSVTAANTTLTISPTTGAVIAGLNLANANTWTGQQIFNTLPPIFGTMTAGSVLFAGVSGTLTQDNANLFFDDSNNRFGVGTGATISARIHSLSTTEQLRIGYDTSNYYSTTVGSTGAVTLDAVGSGSSFRFNDAVGIGVTPNNALCDILGIYTTTGYPLKILNSGFYNAYFQGTAANNQASFYLENDRGSFASYGGFVYGGSTSNIGNLFGVSRADKLFMFADGASNLGMYVGTTTAQPFVIGTNNTEKLRVTSAGLLTFQGITTSFPALKRSSAILQARLADDSAYTDIEVLDTVYGSGWNGSNKVPTQNAVYDKIETITPPVAASQSDQETGTSTTTFVSPGRQQFHASSAKAWVNFNGTGTVAIRSSYNVTSITDNGTGDYTINFTTAFSGANAYTGSVTCGEGGAAATDLVARSPVTADPTTTAWRCKTLNATQTLQVDPPFVCGSFFGDQ